MGNEEKPAGFTVADRRIFAEGGDQPPDAPPDDAKALPPVDFPTFVLSLGSSALISMGEIERPGTEGQAEKNLPMAKHTIDLLSMLQEKTKGNLTPQEGSLLESLLFDLHLRYVSATKPGR